MGHSAEIREAFPQMEEIDDEELREQVVEVWTQALKASSYDALEEVPWWPPAQESFPEWKAGAAHIREVTRVAIGIADALAACFDDILDRDVVIAGALLHDVSKLHELEGQDVAELHEWVPHPHYGVHVLAEAGVSEHLQHIALSHTDRSAVEPRSLEAAVVAAADRMATHGLYQEQTGDISHLF